MKSRNKLCLDFQNRFRNCISDVYLEKIFPKSVYYNLSLMLFNQIFKIAAFIKKMVLTFNHQKIIISLIFIVFTMGLILPLYFDHLSYCNIATFTNYPVEKKIPSFLLHPPEVELSKIIKENEILNTKFNHRQNFDMKQKIENQKTLETEALASLGAAIEMKMLGKSDKALKLFQHALSLQPNHPDVLTQYGEYMETYLNDIVKADHLYSRALSYHPSHFKAMLNRKRTSKFVEDLDRISLEKIDQKRNQLIQIPIIDASLRKIKQEAYYHYIYHTVNIEGNTMTLSQTRSILETGVAIGGKSILEHNEILGLDVALKYINISLVQRNDVITKNDILEIHRKVMSFVDPEQAGKIRKTQVFVGDHIPPHPSALQFELENFIRWLNGESLQLHPIERAALAHYKLVFIHPFVDGNGRTSRLLMNLILMQAGYPPTIIPKQNRMLYYNYLKVANEGDIRPLIRFIAECTDHTLDVYLFATSNYGDKLPAHVQETIQNKDTIHKFINEETIKVDL